MICSYSPGTDIFGSPCSGCGHLHHYDYDCQVCKLEELIEKVQGMLHSANCEDVG